MRATRTSCKATLQRRSHKTFSPKPDARAVSVRSQDDVRVARRSAECPMGGRPTGWWADASILRRLGPVLAEPFTDLQPTLVIGPQPRGTLLGALVAVHLGVGLVELRKDPDPSADSER
jgi:hypothetical protein